MVAIAVSDTIKKEAAIEVTEEAVEVVGEGIEAAPAVQKALRSVYDGPLTLARLNHVERHARGDHDALGCFQSGHLAGTLAKSQTATRAHLGTVHTHIRMDFGWQSYLGRY